MGPSFVVCVFALICGAYSTPLSYDTIVVGLGASGVAAATTLAKAGKRILALEADNRIGGRVKTNPFGDGIVELGAEWIHGTENSSVYELAIQNNISIIAQPVDFKTFRSDGAEVDWATVSDLVEFGLTVFSDPSQEPQPLGEYMTARIRTYIAEKHPSLANDTDFVTEFLHFMDLLIDTYVASNSWNDVNTVTNYEDLKGNQDMSWHKNGYKTLFQILMNTYNDGPGIPNLDIKLSSEVTKITWQPESSANVKVQVADGTIYTASNVIVTVSLGVLKERSKDLFSPPLPNDKIDAISLISFGVVAKVILRFDQRWWNGMPFLFIWKHEDRMAVNKEDKWTTYCEGLTTTMANDDCMVLWFTGEAAKTVEELNDEVLKTKSMELIRKFLGKNYTIPDPVDMIKSNWYSNPFTRGSYSYDNLQSPSNPNARVTLGQPLVDSQGVNRILFAGADTNFHHFSTVHGALDTGFREANRLLGKSTTTQQ